jgi:hypothetical protein
VSATDAVGDVASIFTVSEPLAVFPATSVALIPTLCCPSGDTENEPHAIALPSSVQLVEASPLVPSLAEAATVEEPRHQPALPGVAQLDESDTLGATLSIASDADALAELPAASVAASEIACEPSPRIVPSQGAAAPSTAHATLASPLVASDAACA